ncbi:oligopeptide ABC transporter substrate-binding protein [Periweissella ghanensis]|uniref:Oligopeptide-binding protein OppA n=1 Tax=Periweissella ghanensis TaxID=467997 RepID=A0ABM8ZD67_9LACO|nr:oligopeptide ABC transporter substrate-binding protein [Periweissella ghanensis]MCM0601343.1 oligopeptide ABC transporter substrate-binding protein [Periweissella ghanensis]CAH0419408.1 Oligopeptide-binding protein OppA [Periweissella ghanensis]
MKKTTKYFTGLAAATALFSVVLAGCGNKSATSTPSASVGNLKLAYDNKDKAIKDGTLNIAMVQDTPFQGIFAPVLQQDQVDQFLTEPMSGVYGTMFKTTSQFKIIDGGQANIKLNKADKTAVITLHKGLKWSDGKPVTAKDLEFSYELIANNAYQSQLYTDSLADIVGLAAFHDGKAKTISGITYPNGEDGDSIQIKFNHMTPGMWNSGSGYYLESAEPYHYLKDIKPGDLAGSKQIRQAPLSYGPYKVSNVVAGQSVSYVPNPYWYGPKPKLKKIVTTVVSTSTIAAALKDKKYDIAYQMPSVAYPTVKKLNNYVQTGDQSLSFTYVTYNLGHYDSSKSTNVQDRKTPLQNVALRQAMGYAMNVDQVNQKFNYGLATRANTVIVKPFKDAHDSSVKGFPLDIKKANSLLDKAGFKWDSKHEYRLNTNGKPFKLIFMARSGNSNAEAVAQNYIQQWKQIGVDVALYHDRLTDFNTWAQTVTNGTSNDWDITLGGWADATDPSLISLFGKSTQDNFGHFVSPEFTSILNKIDSTEAIDPAVRQKAFYDMQTYMQKQAFVIPVSYTLDWYPINKRVTGWSNDNANNNTRWLNVGVTADATK